QPPHGRPLPARAQCGARRHVGAAALRAAAEAGRPRLGEQQASRTRTAAAPAAADRRGEPIRAAREPRGQPAMRLRVDDGRESGQRRGPVAQAAAGGRHRAPGLEGRVIAGFIGFGEAGSTIAGGLRTAGVEAIVAFDIAADHPRLGPAIQERARRTGVRLVPSPPALAQASGILFSTVTPSSPLRAAKAPAPFLTPRHLYADLTSVSPALKQDLDRVVSAAGARFVEVAVMAPVLPYGHRVPMLAGGPLAALFAEQVTPFGMRCDVLP